MNSITELLDLEDENAFISDIITQGNTKIITVETHLIPHYCPICNYKMHSRGTKSRKINHPILQDNYKLILNLRQRRWRCTNPDCLYDISESFKFVKKQSRTTNATDMLIVLAYRNLSDTSVQIAKRFNVSDTYAHTVFDKYVKLERLPLTNAISIDEVHIEMDDNGKYALVIQDFYTGDPIDLLRNRKSNVTEPYFLSIPIKERLNVKYLISDMYNPYIAYVNTYFPNAVSVVDSFHVIQWLIHKLDTYIRQLIKKYKQRDLENYKRKIDESHGFLDSNRKPPLSDEVYLLQKYRWLILANQSNITYSHELRMDRHFHRLMNTYEYENALFRIDPKLRDFVELKEMYVQFNEYYAGNPIGARNGIEDIINTYTNCNYPIFNEFANTLTRYKEPIINSFIMVEKIGPGGIYDSRLSNGPIESINRKIKDLKRTGRGYKNFEHFRNRFLYAARSNPVLNATNDFNAVQYMEDYDEI